MMYLFNMQFGVFYPVVAAVKSLAPFVVCQDAGHIFSDFAGFWRRLTNESQLRWVR